MRYKRRKKASDVFREAQYVFAKKVSFDEAFPEIKDISVEVEESGEGVSAYLRKSCYGRKNFPGEFIDCSNPLCYKGGFSIGSIINEMVRSKQKEKETSKLCLGNEASPKGRRIYRKYFNSFKIKVSLTYKDDSEQE